MRKLRAPSILWLLAAFILTAQGSFAQIAHPSAAVPEGEEGATHFSLVSRADPGGGTRSYRCWRWASNQTSQIGCTDSGLGASPGVDLLMEADFENDSDGEFVYYRTGTQPSSASGTWVTGFFPWLPRFFDFGLGMDDPTVIGDYTGDGKADIIMFRCNPN